MEIININDQKLLDDFVSSQKHSQFLQSWQWGEFQKKVSGIVWRLGARDKGKLFACSKIIKKGLPMGKNYLYAGRGPIFRKGLWNQEAGNLLFNEIKEVAEGEATMFLRFEPIFSIKKINFPIIKTMDVQPGKTWLVELDKSEVEILKAMHTKTRYNIKLAERRGVKIIESAADRFEDFWQLLCETGERDEFSTHGRSYYQAMLECDKNFLKLFFAEYKKKPLVAILVVFFGDTATYIHGGSSSEHREVMASHLIHWHAIKLAKKLGHKYYDLYGISEHKWPGVTRFKKGFGGRELIYPGTFDLVYDENWYNVYKMVRKVRRSF